MFFRSHNKQSLSKDNHISRGYALNCVPVRNPQIVEQANENGEICLTYQVQIRPWFQNIVQKITGKPDDIIQRKLQLDTLGTTVWAMINDQRKAREIIDDFQKAHQLNRREAEISVTTVLKELGKRGLIVLHEGGK